MSAPASRASAGKAQRDHGRARDHPGHDVRQRVHPHQRQRRQHADGPAGEGEKVPVDGKIFLRDQGHRPGPQDSSSPSATDNGAATSQRFMWGIVVP